jgi:exportin-2 (importin alpha re-exporter)
MAELAQLAQILDATLDPRQNKECMCISHSSPHHCIDSASAELKIRQAEKQPGFSLQLLHITASDSFKYNTRLASALFFKNFIKRQWTDVEGNYKLPQNEVSAIKTEIIGLMISVPAGIQTQLGEAVSLIADSDFWQRWDTLVDDLISRLTPNNIVVNTGVLQVAHSIFARWRPLFRSDDLYTEINHVLSKFAMPFLSLVQSLDTYIEGHRNSKEELKNAFVELELVLQLFYDLSCQDLSPEFEDNMASIAQVLLKYLMYSNSILETDDESEAGPLENTKANIFELLTLYVGKYYDEFGKYLGSFVESSWNLLTNVGPDAKNDILVSKALQFLTSISKINEQAQTFNNAGVQTQIIEKVIVPNIALRDSDIETFEDEPIEFIRRDLEGSDSETRRRAASDFLKQLSDQFEGSVTELVMAHVNKLLQDYSSKPADNWRSKDTAMNLFYATAAKGVATSTHGVTKVNSLVNIGDFFSQHLAADLQNNDVQPLLKVDAIKYLYVFRSLITKEQWQQVMSLLVNHLGNLNYCVYTYAAITVERVLALSDESSKPMIDPAQIAPLSKDLLEHLFGLLQRDPAPEKIQENEFVMRCIMRVLIVIKESVASVMESSLRHLINITNIILKNPSNPKFYYYHFEAIGALIRFSPPSNSEALLDALFPSFIAILQESVEEFMPYVFQLLGALLEGEPEKPLPNKFQPMIAPIIAPQIWESRGNIPALVRVLSAMLPRASQEMIKNNQLEPILGIFQKLVSTKVFEGNGFDLLEAVIQTFPASDLEPYWIHLITIMLTRLKTPTQSFQLRFIRFFHFISSRDDKGLGTDFFVAATDKVQNDIFRSLYTGIILPKTQELARPIDRKIAAVSLTKILADSQAFVTRYPRGWPLTCNTLLKLLEDPPLPQRADDLIVDHDVDDSIFGVGFTQLNTIRKPILDPFANITDLRKWVGQYLRAADSRNGGRVGQSVQQLGPDAQTVLGAYMQL